MKEWKRESKFHTKKECKRPRFWFFIWAWQFSEVSKWSFHMGHNILQLQNTNNPLPCFFFFILHSGGDNIYFVFPRHCLLGFYYLFQVFFNGKRKINISMFLMYYELISIFYIVYIVVRKK